MNMGGGGSVTREKKPANLSPSAPTMIYLLPLTGAERGEGVGSIGCPVPKRKKKKTPLCQTLEACSTSCHLVDFAAMYVCVRVSVCSVGQPSPGLGDR